MYIVFRLSLLLTIGTLCNTATRSAQLKSPVSTPSNNLQSNPATPKISTVPIAQKIALRNLEE